MSKTLAKYGKDVGRSWNKLPTWTKIVAVVIVALFLTPTIFQSTYVTGYDGVIAEIEDIDSGHPVQEKDLGITTAYIKQSSRGLFHAPCGLSIQIQGAVNVNKDDATTIKSIIDETDEYYKKWELNIYHCTMGVTLSTSGGGLDAAEDVDFIIRLKENDFSFFTDANETFAFIIQVATANQTSESGIVDVIPDAGGYYFPLTTVDTDPVPDWAQASGFNWGNLEKAQIVDFILHVNKMQPTSLWGAWRVDSQVDWMLEIDVFVVGHWNFIKPDKKWTPPDPDPPFLDWLFVALGEMWDDIANALPSLFAGAGGIIVLILAAVVGVFVLKATILKKTVGGRK